jgi:hypothetical protein
VDRMTAGQQDNWSEGQEERRKGRKYKRKRGGGASTKEKWASGQTGRVYSDKRFMASVPDEFGLVRRKSDFNRRIRSG